MSYKTLEISPTRATVLPGALVRREQTSVKDHSTPEAAKQVTDALTQQVRDLAAGAGIFKDATIFKDVAVVSGDVVRIRHGKNRRVYWLVIDWVATNNTDPCQLARDVYFPDGDTVLSLQPSTSGTVSILVF